MNDDPTPADPAADADPPAPTAIARQLRRLPAVLLNAAAALSTTVIAVAIEPKTPPYKGD